MILTCITDSAIVFFGSNMNGTILSILLFPSIFLYIKNCMICYKNDSAERGILLFFLNVFYSPFYSIKVLKKGWLNESLRDEEE